MRRHFLAELETIPLVERDRHEGKPVVEVTSEAPGAWKNGTRVRKRVFEPGDFHLVGAMATVKGSLGPIDGEFGYFVRWDDAGDVPVFVRGRKLELAS